MKVSDSKVSDSQVHQGPEDVAEIVASARRKARERLADAGAPASIDRGNREKPSTAANCAACDVKY
jgi:hypothetical protein